MFLNPDFYRMLLISNCKHWNQDSRINLKLKHCFHKQLVRNDPSTIIFPTPTTGNMQKAFICDLTLVSSFFVFWSVRNPTGDKKGAIIPQALFHDGTDDLW